MFVIGQNPKYNVNCKRKEQFYCHVVEVVCFSYSHDVCTRYSLRHAPRLPVLPHDAGTSSYEDCKLTCAIRNTAIHNDASQPCLTLIQVGRVSVDARDESHLNELLSVHSRRKIPGQCLIRIRVPHTTPASNRNF